ncbi:MAG: transglutaminase-like cysteine peptidase [Proteobacteria bacterium]|nr:transglutaminase-like cysteine peptidase [Pseudomonadota bacterium]MBU1640647.1 transglutaminase-like cysteine peptidase [Pseudomonadota bacterium]
MRSVWELVETVLVFVVIGALLSGGFGFSDKTAQQQDESQHEKEQAEHQPLPQPQPQPQRLWLKPQLFKPEPVPVFVEDGEPRQGKVMLGDAFPRRSSAYFQEQITKIKEQSYVDYPMFWWTGTEKKVFTMTAMGRDNLHHVANAFLLGFQPFATDKMWVPMQTIATRLQYRQDEKQFGGMMDLWQTSKQAYYWLRGDCEDHALLLADWLIEMGYDARVVAGMHGKEGHAWVVVVDQGKTFLLEATSKRRQRLMPLAVSLPEYRPEYMFNRHDFWVNSGSFFTANYLDKKWQKRSTFEASY